MKIPQRIDEKMFYSIGKYAFLFIAVSNLTGLIQGISLGQLQGFQIVSQLASVIFNFAVAGFFGYLKEKFSIVPATTKDLDEITKLLEENNTNVQKKGNHAEN